MNTPMPLVSFVIPVLDDAERLGRCLESIRRSEHDAAGLEMIVVDNGCVDGSASVARRAGAKVVALPNARVSELRNRGARLGRGQIVAFVDADHAINPAWVRSAVETLQTPGVGAAGAPYRAPENGTWVQQMYDRLRARHAGRRDVEWLASGNIAVWRTAFEQVGGFDPRLDACEDVDFCQRLRAAGLRVISDDRLESIHFGDPATLRALFRGELWRGRGNVRTSFRRPTTVRLVASALVPLVDLALMAVTLAGLATATRGGLAWSAIAAAGIGALAALRAVRMLARRGSMTAREVGRALLVAAVYDLARALALVTRARHPRARPTAAA